MIGPFFTYKGVPQDYDLSPLLYNFYMHKYNLPQLLDYIYPNCNYLCFADDIALFVNSPNVNKCLSDLESNLNRLSLYLHVLGLSIAPEKRT